MSDVPGVMLAGRDNVRTAAVALARTAARIAAVPLPADHGLAAWRSWAPDHLQPPAWGEPALWREGIRRYRSQDPPQFKTKRLLHHDFHPLNVLWDRTGVSGVVDWVNTCVGHPHAELGHCRWNLVTLADRSAADAFLTEYLAHTAGHTYDPWWDVAAVMGLLPGPIATSGWQAVGRLDLTPTQVIAATESFLRAALG